jgi:hypothetical protein
MTMPDHEREEILQIVKDCIKHEIDARIVRALIWIVGVGLANFAAIVTGVWMFWSVSQSVETTRTAVVHDRWTGTMEQFAEYERTKTVVGYAPIDVRMIQQKYPPQ